MMAKEKAVFRFEGPDSNDGRLDMSVYAAKIKEFHGFLENSAKQSGQKNLTFQVLDSSISSPAQVTCVPYMTGNATSFADFACARRYLEQVENGEFSDLPNNCLSAIEAVANLDDKKVKWAEIQFIGSDDGHFIYKLDDPFRDKLKQARSGEERDVSTIDGKLEMINIHSNPGRFKIYTFFGGIVCDFPKELLGMVQKNLGDYVSVSGECFYRPADNRPYRIKVRQMRALPASKSVSAFDDLYGIAPNATGNKSSEEFVREMRADWDRDAI